MEESEALLALSALAQETRLEVVRRLVKSEPEGIQAGELARLVGVPQNTMSAHLSILSRAGLVKGERQSRAIVYRARIHQIQGLVLYLLQDCCGGKPEICGPLISSLSACCPPRKVRRNG